MLQIKNVGPFHSNLASLCGGYGIYATFKNISVTRSIIFRREWMKEEFEDTKVAIIIRISTVNKYSWKWRKYHNPHIKMLDLGGNSMWDARLLHGKS
jgi:hypothetical protein